MAILRQRILTRLTAQNAVAPIRNLFLLLPQQMIMPRPPGIHRVLSRYSFFFPRLFFSPFSLSSHFPALLCCDQVFISLAISHFLYPCRASLLPSLLLSCAFYLTHIYCKSVCCPISVLTPSFSSRICQTRALTWGHSLHPPRHTLYLHSRFHCLSNFRWTLPLPLDHSPFRPSATLFRPPLRKCVVYRLPSVCLYGPLAASKLNLCASNLQFHTPLCLLVSHKTNRSFFGVPSHLLADSCYY